MVLYLAVGAGDHLFPFSACTAFYGFMKTLHPLCHMVKRSSAVFGIFYFGLTDNPFTDLFILDRTGVDKQVTVIGIYDSNVCRDLVQNALIKSALRLQLFLCLYAALDLFGQEVSQIGDL
ncbi:hypothetical protein D3C86_1947070 [compost metagenome]